MPVFRFLFLVAALSSGALQAADLRVAVVVQDAAQVSPQGDLVPSVTAGADLVAFTDELAREICRRLVGSPAPARAFAGRLGQAVNLDNLRGARVAAMEGSQQQAFLNVIAAERELTVVATATTAGAFDTLGNGSADFALLPIRTGYALISHDKARRFGFVGPAVADHGLGDTVHIILPKQKEALRRSLNQAIAEIRADGTGHRIMRRHFPVNLD